jgi:hypothetical protein
LCGIDHLVIDLHFGFVARDSAQTRSAFVARENRFGLFRIALQALCTAVRSQVLIYRY